MRARRPVNRLAGGTAFGLVSVRSPTGDDIAYVVVETGSLGNAGSPTGVMRAVGSQLLVLDDLTYDPPVAPPASSFSLGASPPSQRIARGATVTAAIPVTWFDNPTPASSPIAFEISAPPGITASITPNPSTSGQAILTMTAAAGASPGPATVKVDGHVGKGTPGEKRASASVDLLVEDPFTVQLLPGTPVPPCTPSTWRVRIPTADTIKGQLTIAVKVSGGIAITAVDGVAVPSVHQTQLTRTPDQTGVVVVDVQVAAEAPGAGGLLFAAVSSETSSVSASGVVTAATGGVSRVETVDTSKQLTDVSAPMYRRPALHPAGTGSPSSRPATARNGLPAIATVQRQAIVR